VWRKSEGGEASGKSLWWAGPGASDQLDTTTLDWRMFFIKTAAEVRE
jgi:hypothetical protein